ncbi:hypothetical protein OAD77_01120 [Porticoccaceae bacterium]|nr:hypothetical protein [Porticoccaceae bacterium]MDC1452810.1 hypothetical protein [Porticoccaceae bacterium]
MNPFRILDRSAGTPVSVMIITSKRQQLAWQVEQLTSGCKIF